MQLSFLSLWCIKILLLLANFYVKLSLYSCWWDTIQFWKYKIDFEWLKFYYVGVFRSHYCRTFLFANNFYRFSLLSWVILQLIHFIHMKQTLKLKSEIGKRRKTSLISKYLFRTDIRWDGDRLQGCHFTRSRSFYISFLLHILGLISPTCLWAAFTQADPKSAKGQTSHQCFLVFWDLLKQKLLVKTLVKSTSGRISVITCNACIYVKNSHQKSSSTWIKSEDKNSCYKYCSTDRCHTTSKLSFCLGFQPKLPISLETFYSAT